MSADQQGKPMYLLVDDDEVFSRLLARSLKRNGIESLTAHNSQDAMKALEQAGNAVSHAVVDLNMGDDSGLNLIPELLQRQPALKIIVLTGYSSIATTVEAMKRGAVNYLCKPASVEDVMNAFNETGDAGKQVTSLPFRQPSVGRVEWEYIQKTLADNNGNVSATARALGMHRRTLQRKLQKKPVTD